jgi:short-chain fatty acids transporter
MIRIVGRSAYRVARNWIPDPFVFALILTFVAFILGLIFSPQNDYQANGAFELFNASYRMLGYWQDGFWNLLEFSMQMSLILVLGGALAYTRPVESLINRLARMPKSGASAAALVSAVACIAALLNWGLGLVVGALMARRVAKLSIRRRIVVHYPLLGAAGYTGLMVWHGGLSGSGPLAMNTGNSALVQTMGGISLPLSQTIFSPLNLVMTIVLLISIPTVCYFLAPRYRGGEEADLDLLPDSVMADDELFDDDEEAKTPAEKMERSRWLMLPFGIAGLFIICWKLVSQGFSLSFLDLNSVNWILLFLSLTLHKNVKQFLAAVGRIAKATVGIIVQFPFYAGIMGMMIASGTITVLAQVTASITMPVLYPVLAFFSAGIVNVFVPSGGGQVAVQGPIIYETTKLLGVPFDLGFMAMCYGDQLTNMLQPFWALPLLGLTGLKARDLLGYTITIMLICGLLMILVLLGASLILVN